MPILIDAANFRQLKSSDTWLAAMTPNLVFGWNTVRIFSNADSFNKRGRNKESSCLFSCPLQIYICIGFGEIGVDDTQPQRTKQLWSCKKGVLHFATRPLPYSSFYIAKRISSSHLPVNSPAVPSNRPDPAIGFDERSATVFLLLY